MSANREYKKLWYKKQAEWLRAELGGMCSKCLVKRKRPLQFDVIIPVDNGQHHRGKGPVQRMRFYLRQYANSNLRLLCNRCNGHKGAVEDKAYYARLKDQQEQESIEAEGQALAAMDIEPIPF